MSKTDPINIANPPGGSPPALGDDYIRTLARAVAEVLAVDHYMSINGNAYDGDDNGKHSKVTFREVLSSKPTLAANDKGVSYVKGVTPELHFEDAAGNEIQLTSGGRLYLGSVSIANGNAVICNNTSNGSDNRRIDLAGGGDTGTGRGGYVRVNGNQQATNPGQVELKPGYIDAGESVRSVISADGTRITNVADPSNAQDAATKAYVDAGKFPSVLSATGNNTYTVNLTLTTGTWTVIAFGSYRSGAVGANSLMIDGTTVASNESFGDLTGTDTAPLMGAKSSVSGGRTITVRMTQTGTVGFHIFAMAIRTA